MDIHSLYPCSTDLPSDILAHDEFANPYDIRILYKLASKIAWISIGNIHASWTYTWISLLKADHQIPA